MMRRRAYHSGRSGGVRARRVFVRAGADVAGIMSGLTLGLMSLGLVELEILQRSGTDTEKKRAGKINTNILYSIPSVTDKARMQGCIFCQIKICLLRFFQSCKSNTNLLSIFLCNAAAMEEEMSILMYIKGMIGRASLLLACY